MTSRAGTLPFFPVPGEEEISVGVRPQSPPCPLEEDPLPPGLSLLYLSTLGRSTFLKAAI